MQLVVRGKGIRFVEEREREGTSAAHSSGEVVGWLLVVEMAVVKSVVRVLVAEDHGGEREIRESSWWQ
jgi:hypothetical protein